MRAIMVSVDYSDMLAVTLPYNRHHFSEVTIVTSSKDWSEVKSISSKNDARVLSTDLFYAKGATFNKWAALEWGLDEIGREGWICLMDADVLWPKDSKCEDLQVGNLYGAVRRMLLRMPVPFSIPHENTWHFLPIHRNIAEWAGYTQVFHATDPVLGPPPWHEVNWKHAGGADSFFQNKWTPKQKIRFPWEVLHLGPAGANWYGRASAYLNGVVPADSQAKTDMVAKIWQGRRGKKGEDAFREEKL